MTSKKNMTTKKGPTDQITNIEKRQVKSRARRFVLDLLDAPLGEGLQIYQETVNELYDGKARLRICLKCGDINTTSKLTKDTHRCTMDFEKLAIPYLVTTSWLKMREFFLGKGYSDALRKLGVEPEPVKERIPKPLAEIGVVDEKSEEEITEIEQIVE
ncbi:MAG: hypothetical protein H7647_11170 [Candidatus Heimdallarchaeota archaeon]|nr:hypothetical protein [Candidatus Heimdallarchaeota archaeon]MCK4254987.1 hypothetical protein [Candidatus Heimdallarchaeota archaeon]